MAFPQNTYIANTPQPTRKISQTQKPILDNFKAVDELIKVNHVSFNDAVNYGKHTTIIFPNQSGVPTTTSTQMSLYAAVASDPDGSEIFYTYPTQVTGIQLTGLGGLGLNATNGYSYLAGGILMKWGLATGIITGANVITFPTGGGIPAFATSIFNVQYAPAVSYTLTPPSAYISAQTLTTFTLNVPSTMSTSIYWFAIGI